jgi:hypothetical protein
LEDRCAWGHKKTACSSHRKKVTSEWVARTNSVCPWLRGRDPSLPRTSELVRATAPSNHCCCNNTKSPPCPPLLKGGWGDFDCLLHTPYCLLALGIPVCTLSVLWSVTPNPFFPWGAFCGTLGKSSR